MSVQNVSYVKALLHQVDTSAADFSKLPILNASILQLANALYLFLRENGCYGDHLQATLLSLEQAVEASIKPGVGGEIGFNQELIVLKSNPSSWLNTLVSLHQSLNIPADQWREQWQSTSNSNSVAIIASSGADEDKRAKTYWAECSMEEFIGILDAFDAVLVNYQALNQEF